jgi:hypothetical protein
MKREQQKALEAAPRDEDVSGPTETEEFFGATGRSLASMSADILEFVEMHGLKRGHMLYELANIVASCERLLSIEEDKWAQQ